MSKCSRTAKKESNQKINPMDNAKLIKRGQEVLDGQPASVKEVFVNPHGHVFTTESNALTSVGGNAKELVKVDRNTKAPASTTNKKTASKKAASKDDKK